MDLNEILAIRLNITSEDNKRIRNESREKWKREKWVKYVKYKNNQTKRNKKLGRVIQGWIPKIVAKKIEQYVEKNGLKTAVKREIYIEIIRAIMETNRKLYPKKRVKNRSKSTIPVNNCK